MERRLLEKEKHSKQFREKHSKEVEAFSNYEDQVGVHKPSKQQAQVTSED